MTLKRLVGFLMCVGLALSVGCATTGKSLEGAGDGDSLFDEVQSFLVADEWFPEQIQGETILKMSFQGTDQAWLVFAQTREEARQVIFYSVLVSNVMAERRAAAAEYLTMANYGLWLGNFELDMSDGEVRFKTSVDVEGGMLTETMIRNLVYANVTLVDRYLPGLNQVVYEGMDPGDAIRQIEG